MTGVATKWNLKKVTDKTSMTVQKNKVPSSMYRRVKSKTKDQSLKKKASEKKIRGTTKSSSRKKGEIKFHESTKLGSDLKTLFDVRSPNEVFHKNDMNKMKDRKRKRSERNKCKDKNQVNHETSSNKDSETDIQKLEFFHMCCQVNWKINLSMSYQKTMCHQFVRIMMSTYVEVK